MTESIINLLCGVGLFLYGIFMMSEHTEKAFGEKLRHTLGVLTKNRFTGMLTGIIVTGLIQSSSATTVMTVSFVSSGLMSLSQAVGIVMGANIGTTVTSLLIAFNFSLVAPLAIFLGVAGKLLSKNEQKKHMCELITGFGLLFLGMNTMSSSFAYLKENEAFLSLVSVCEGKISCILVGFIMTAILQSSSATVGILQALALSGVTDAESALYIIFGQNIGAVIPTLLSAAGASKQAKQVGIIHLLFNLIGTVFFFTVFEIFPFPDFISRIGNESMQVSFMHIAFNVLSTAILLPFGDLLIKLSDIKIPLTVKTERGKKREI
ncbi:MAG: Na/Pi cotransporter family protein [Clostridia bacterium]|nr:Na/Pi cotransporter family protein [Clostridia bacterium]